MKSEASETSRVQQIYAAIIAAFILNFVPNPLVQIVASLFFIGVFIALYVVRKLGKPESLTDNHMTYLIRSVWIGGLLVIIGTLLGAIYFIGTVGLEDYARLGRAAMEQGRPDDFFMVFQQRYPQEVMIAVLTSLLPGVAYLAFRLAKGLARAIKGYRVANPLSWF